MMLDTQKMLDEPLHKGDVLALTFTYYGSHINSKIEEIIHLINSDVHYEVIHWTFPTSSTIRFEVKVVQNPVISASVLIALTISAALGMFIYLSLDKVEKIAEASPVATAAGSVGILAVVVLVGFIYFSRRY